MKRRVADWEDGSSSDGGSGGSSTVVVCSTTITTTVGIRNLVVVVYHSNNSSNDTIKISNIYSLKISNIYYLLILFIFVHSYYIAIAISDQPAGVEVERVVLTCKWNVYGYIYIIIIASIST
jgi:hypothetical protein